VTGFFSDTATFGLGEPNQTDLTSAGRRDIFVAKYDRDGALLWATQVGGDLSDEGFGIATTKRGDSYVTGYFSGTATFGPGEPNETQLTAAGGPPFRPDMFVAKYDRAGALLWASQADLAGFGLTDQGFGIATTRHGDSYVAMGSFVHLVIEEISVAKFDREGALLWASQADQAGFGATDQGRSIATTERGDSYVTGSFSGTATLGPGEVDEPPLTAVGKSDIFVAKYR
jgi:hypothetical protein